MQVAIASLLAVPDRLTPPDRPLAALSDDDLLRGLSRLLAQSRRVESELVAHIGEVDARRLWARHAFPSMFAYCTGALRLSESEAYLRIAVGRASREYPPILRLLAEGRAHLSGIALLAPHLTPENAERLLARAAFRSKREIEELVAEMAPRPDVPASIRKLPRPRSGDPTPSGMGRTVTPAVTLDESAPSPSASRVEGTGGEGSSQRGSPRPDVVPTAPACLSAPPPSPPFQPLAPGRYKVQFTASAEFRRKLERLCVLLRTRVPDGDLGTVLEEVVSEKLERLEARRFGGKGREASTGWAARGAEAGAAPASRYVPASVRRAVFDRDGGRCTYVDAAGQRCAERDRLEYHHRHPFGLGGSHRLENLRLMCRAHNTLDAEHDFGRRTMARYRRSAASGSKPPPLTQATHRAGDLLSAGSRERATETDVSQEERPQGL